MTDTDIIELYWARSENAITETDTKYGGYCRTVSFNILHDMRDAEECVNDTWLDAWRTMPPQRPNKLRAFLAKITRNLSLDRYKFYNADKRRLTQTAVALEELGDCVSDRREIDDQIDEMVLTEIIERFLYSQSTEKRNVFIRRYWHMDSVDDIAKRYGMSQRKITSMLFRMRQNLRDQLEKEGITV